MNEGRQSIERALQLAPKDAYVNVDYAVHLFREHSYAEAEKYIGKALFFDPQNWQALWYQLKLSEMFNDRSKAKIHFARNFAILSLVKISLKSKLKNSGSAVAFRSTTSPPSVNPVRDKITTD